MPQVWAVCSPVKWKGSCLSLRCCDGGGGLPEHRYVGHPSAGPEWRWCGKPEPIAGGKELGLPLRRLLSWRFGWGQACFADWGIGGVG